MGKGAGKFYGQSAYVRVNKVILEFSEIPKTLAKDLIRIVSSKLSFGCVLITF